MIGIYKITSPSNRIYIGQSIDIERRIYKYKKDLCIQQTRLNNSFLKYGVENHVFEIIKECPIEDLNCSERYYQDLFKVLTKNGLNCRLTASKDKSGKQSESTKLKISNSNKISHSGKSLSETHKKNISKGGMGKIMSKESRKNLSEARKGIIFSKTHIENLKKSHGKKVLDTSTGIEYYSARYASECLNLNWNTLMARLNGNCINNTTLIYIK